jgi:ABC-2 type transport system ATP-binding protein
MDEIETAIEVDTVWKFYGTHPALRGISFHVRKGQIFAILGPNGAGKTTLIEILEAYRKPDKGRVLVLGMDPVKGGYSTKDRIGIVLQQERSDQFLSVREMLQMYSSYYSRPLDVDDVIKLVDLESVARNRVSKISGGQRRRLDLGLGLIGDPDLIFLDEPTTGFDPSARRQAWRLIKGLAQTGKTVVLTTHYMDEAQFLADYILIMSTGEIVAEGSPELIGARSEHAEVRFSISAAMQVSELPIAGRLDGEEMVITCTDPTRVLHTLTGWAIDRGVALDTVKVSRPSLEDIYLSLTEAGGADQ